MDRPVIMKKGHIYKITSPTGKIYIGKTMNVKVRFRQYKGLACKTQPALYKSFFKYGVNNHKFEIIGLFNESELSDKEMFYIQKFDSFKSGLNCTKGGDGSFMSGDDNVSKREDVRQKMSESKIRFYKNGGVVPHKGKKHTNQAKEKIKQKRLEQESSGKSIRHIMILDTETGIFYKSIKEAACSTTYIYKSFFYKIQYTKQTRYVKI